MPLAILTLILPTYTTSAPWPLYTPTQLGFASLATLVLYSGFLYVQTIRLRDHFLSDSGDDKDDASHGTPGMRQVWESVVMLLVALVAVVLLAKGTSGSVASIGAPMEVIGLLVALRLAWRNELQKSLNLALGSSLATIGLTIPAVSALAIVLEQPLELGIDLVDTVLLVLTFGVILATLGGGRTNILPGFVHLILFATFVFVIFVP